MMADRIAVQDVPRSSHATTAVRTATRSDVPGVSRALARAFFDDPAASHCLPGSERRLLRLERGFSLFLRRVYLRHGLCFTTPGRTGAALWLPPGHWKASPLRELRLLPGMAVSYGADLRRVLRVLDFLERRHPEDPHYYLPFVGVDPAHQGLGIGSALLRPVLERCDREGAPAYLEATSDRNRELYLRHGFEVAEEVRLPAGGPPVWRMWRHARAQS